MRIYTADALVTPGGQPIAGFAAPSGTTIKYVAGDGTKLSASAYSQTLGAYILVAKPNGGTYTSTTFNTNKNILPVGLSASGGYLMVTGYPADALVYKIDANLGFTEVPFASYNFPS